MRRIPTSCRTITDLNQSLPLPLEGGRLKEFEVHSEGWYVEAASERVGELAVVIYEFLPEMLVGQKVILLDNGGKEHEGKTL